MAVGTFWVGLGLLVGILVILGLSMIPFTAKKESESMTDEEERLLTEIQNDANFTRHLKDPLDATLRSHATIVKLETLRRLTGPDDAHLQRGAFSAKSKAILGQMRAFHRSQLMLLQDQQVKLHESQFTPQAR